MKTTKILPVSNRPGTRRTAARLGAVTVATLLAASTQAQVPVFTNVWNVTNTAFPDLPASGDVVRGIAISPVTTNVVYVSRSLSNHITTLSAADGYNRLGSGMAIKSLASPGPLLHLAGGRVANDGSVYAVSVSGSPTSRLVVHRWLSDTDFTTPPVIVYDSTNYFTLPNTSFQWRAGDYIDLRGGGTNTEIVVAGVGSGANLTTNLILLRPTDAELTNFTATTINIPGAANICGGGVTFEGTNQAVFIKPASSLTTYRLAYNLSAGTSTVTATFNIDTSTSVRSISYYEGSGVKLIAAVQASATAPSSATAHRGKVYQLNGPSNAVQVLDVPLPLPTAANGNGVAMTDFVNGCVVFSEPNNGIAFYAISGFMTNFPPTVSGPIGGTYVEGYPVTLTASVGGTTPIYQQWYFNTNTPIPGATNTSYSLGPVKLADTGTNHLIATNAFGVATGSFAGLTVLPGKYSNFATNLWTLAPGSRPYLTTGDTQRGLAYDAVSNVVVLVSRSPSNLVALLSADTGAEIGMLDVSAFYSPYTPPGTFPINMAGVADDGAVYVANLLASATTDFFSIYRWQNADPLALPSQSYLGNPAVGRLGDTMSVRGAGISTEILCAFRTGTNVALFTGDGYNFSPTIIAVTNLPADAVSAGFAGLGVAFGKGNTFWAKSSNFRLRRVAYDAATGLGEVIETYDSLPLSDAPLGVDNVNGYVATIGFGQTPQNLALWDVSQGPPNAVQLDRELFGANNVNANGTGAVAVDVAGGRLFALDSNNGLIALAYGPRLGIVATPEGSIVTWSGPGTLQATTNLLSGWTDLPTATSPYTNAATAQIFFRVKR